MYKLQGKELIYRLERASETLQKYIKVLKGEEKDFTGVGLYNIFIQQLEMTGTCKILTKEEDDFY